MVAILHRGGESVQYRGTATAVADGRIRFSTPDIVELRFGEPLILVLTRGEHEFVAAAEFLGIADGKAEFRVTTPWHGLSR